jgi:hypothetical protein
MTLMLVPVGDVAIKKPQSEEEEEEEEEED